MAISTIYKKLSFLLCLTQTSFCTIIAQKLLVFYVNVILCFNGRELFTELERFLNGEVTITLFMFKQKRFLGRVWMRWDSPKLCTGAQP